jgi:hypothetical protein
MKDYMTRYLASDQFSEPLVQEVILDLTRLDALHASLRLITVAWNYMRGHKPPFKPNEFDFNLRKYMSYLLDRGTLYDIEMGWEDVGIGIYKVSIKPTPIAEAWDIRLHVLQRDIIKFAECRYWNAGQTEREDYKPFVFVARFRPETFFEGVAKIDEILEEANKTTEGDPP